MPLFLEPDQKYEIILESDEKMPVETRPVFFAKSVTMRKHRQIADLINREDVTTAEEFFNTTVEALSAVICGWKNINDPETGKPIEYNTEALEDVLTSTEARELIYKAIHNNHLNGQEKKS